jgi:hypothetical protein
MLHVDSWNDGYTEYVQVNKSVQKVTLQGMSLTWASAENPSRRWIDIAHLLFPLYRFHESFLCFPNFFDFFRNTVQT